MREISFDGIPFSVEEEKVMDCQYGEQYFNTSTNKPLTEQGFNTSTNPKPKRLWLQGTQKIGCFAKVTIKHYTLYPDYAVVTRGT